MSAPSHGDLLHVSGERGAALRARRLGAELADQLAERFGALGDPTRLTLALALREGEELCVCDLSWVVERSQNLVSHHMRALKGQGLVRARREGKMMMYSLTLSGEALVEAALHQVKEGAL